MKMNQKAKQLICVLLCGLLLLATTPVCLPTAQAETGGSADAAFAAAFNDLSWMYYGDGYFFTEATDPKAEFVNKFLLHTRVLEQYAPDGADEFTVSAELYENHAFTYFQETDTLRAALRQQSIYNDGVYSSYIGGWGGPAVNFVYNSYADLGENGYEVYSFILWTYENDMTADDPGDEYTPSADDVEGVDYIVFQYDWDPDTDVYGKIVGGVKSKVVYDGTAPVKYLSIEQMSSSDFLALIKEKCTAHCYTDADDTTCNVCYEVRSAESDETPDCSTISGYVPTVDIIRDPGYWEADYATAVDVVSAASGKGVTVSFSGAGNQSFHTYCTQTYNLDGLHLSLRNLTGNGFSVAFFGYTDDVDFSGNALRFINYASGSVVLPKHPFDSTIEMNTDIAPFTTDVDIKIKRLDNGDWEYNINGDAIILTDEFVTGLVGDTSAVRVQFFENVWVHSAMGAHSFDVVALHNGLCADELAAEEHEKKEIADTIAGDSEVHKVSADDFNGNYEYHVSTGVIQWQNNADGGVHCSINAFETATLGVNYLQQLSLDGAHIVVSALNNPTEFGLVIGQTPSNGTADIPYRSLVRFFEDGGVGLNPAGDVIITGSDAVRAMLAGTTTLLSFAVSEGSVSLTVANEAGQSTGTFAAYGDEWTDRTKAYIAFVGAFANANLEFDILAIHGGDKLCANDQYDNTVRPVVNMIDAIGEVTLESGSAIEAAEAAYAALTDAQKALVENYDVLTAARAEYDALVAAAEKEAADKAAAAEVDALISAIGTVTLESGDAIEAAEDAYAALTDAQKAKVTKTAELDAARAEYDALVAAAEKEAADKAAAKAFDNMVANLGEITLESGDAIQAAYDSYAALTADQKKLVTKMAELDAAYCEYTILVEQDEADKAAAAEVDALITAIGTVTLESKAAIEAAEEAYAALTDAQKAKVTKTAELDAARAEYDALVAEKEAADKAAAKAVDDRIQYVSAMITLESGPAIKEVEDAYAALTDDQKKLVTMRAYLTAARVQYDALVKQDEADKAAAADVDALITAIGAVTLESGDAIEAAEDAYAALTDAQKAKVAKKADLDAARAEYDALVAEKEAADKAAAKAFDNMVANLGEITLESGDDIRAAYDAYAALTADQKKLVTKMTELDAAYCEYTILVEQEEADKAAAADVDALITAIGTVTLESGDAIEAAEEAYAALTDAQKGRLTNYDVLTAARAQYDALVAEKEAADKAAAKAFDNMVANLGEITLESGDDIRAAYDAYAALTADQKKLVTKMTELDAAYCEYTILVEQEEADKAAAADVDALITAIGTVTLDSKAAIEAAEDAYAALTDAQKAKVTQKTELDAARAQYNALLVEWNILNDSGSHKVSSNNFNGNDAQQVINGHIQWQNNADGGVHCSVDAFDQAYKGINYLRELSLDGAHIVVSNLNSGPFALFLGKAPSDGTVDTIGRSAILFDTNGNVFNPQWGSVVISDSDAVRAMFAGMTTLLSFAVSDDGTVSLTVANEAGQSTGVLIVYDEQWTDHTKTYVAFVSAFAGGFVDFDVLAIHGGDEACGEEQYEKVIRPVIDLIDAIGEVTLDSGDAIKAAEEAYTSLTKAQKKFVANYEVLAAARRTYAGLVLFDGGDGTAERPLLISTKAQLDCVRLYPYAHFKLLNDIVFTEADFAEGGAFYNGGAGWTPIGTVDDPFTGVFDGNGHTIKNLYICVVDHTDYLDNGPVCVGLFGCVLSGTVKNLGMVNSSITAEVSNTWCCIGSIVGYLADGTVSDCYSMGTVSTGDHYSEVGGIVGRVSGRSTVSGCYNVGNVSSVGDRVGGIAGSVDGLGSTISGCYNVGAVSVSNNGSHYAGGIVGTTAGYATVTDCYNAGSVNGNYAGGIVGTTHGYTTVTNCYNVGSLNGDWVGGIVGELTYGTVTNCYYLNTVQQGAQDGQNACTYEQMRQQETFQGFDFDAVWFIDDGSYGFPQLRNIPHFMPVSVTITQLPDTLTYFEGDSLDLAGMILTVTYNNGANGIVTDYTVSGYDPTPGIKVITVTYGGKTATFEVEVIAKAMVGITITKQPDKLIYLEGGSLDLTGMVVTGIHNNGTSEIVTDYTVSGYTSTPGIKVITVTFGGLTATFEVEVIAKSPVSITVTKRPDKLVYLEGDSFSKAGLEVIVNYDNGTSEIVTDCTVSGYDPTPGVKTVTVTFGGLTTSFEVEVVAKSLTSVIVVKQPAKLTYLEGESFDGAGMVVAAIYDNNVMEMVTAYIVSGYDSTPGTKTITVSFGGFTDTFTVVVNAAKEEETVVGEQLREELSTTKPGETVTLEGDAKVEQLMIPAGVTLDLNGHTLEGDYLAFFGNVEGGTIKAPKDHVVFLANNTKLPVWNGEEYVLVEAPTFQHLYTVKNNTLTYTFLPTFDASIHALLAAGGEASNVTVTVQMSWSPSSGGTASQNFVFADKFVKTVIDSYKNGRYGQVFTITLSNAAALTNLQYSAVVSSGTGASFAPDTPAPKV